MKTLHVKLEDEEHQRLRERSLGFKSIKECILVCCGVRDGVAKAIAPESPVTVKVDRKRSCIEGDEKVSVFIPPDGVTESALDRADSTHETFIESRGE